MHRITKDQEKNKVSEERENEMQDTAAESMQSMMQEE
jgi:hypothetical protein